MRHGTDEGILIRVLGQERKDLGNSNTGDIRGQVRVELAGVVRPVAHFGVKSVRVRRSAVEKYKNDGLGRRIRVGSSPVRGPGSRLRDIGQGGLQHSGQAQAHQPAAGQKGLPPVEAVLRIFLGVFQHGLNLQ